MFAPNKGPATSGQDEPAEKDTVEEVSHLFQMFCLALISVHCCTLFVSYSLFL